MYSIPCVPADGITGSGCGTEYADEKQHEMPDPANLWAWSFELNLLSDEEWERSGEGVPRDRQLRRGLDPLYRGNAPADLPRRSLDVTIAQFPGPSKPRSEGVREAKKKRSKT